MNNTNTKTSFVYFHIQFLNLRMILTTKTCRNLKRIFRRLDTKINVVKFFTTENDESNRINIPSMPSNYIVPDIWLPPSDEKMGKFGGMNSHLAGPRSEELLPRGKFDLQLYSLGTPNGQKVTIMLEELGVEYDAWKISLAKLAQFTSGFVGLNPNSKIPAMYDYDVPKDEPPIRVFESGSILLYLSEKFDNSLIPKDRHKRAECLNWLMWQMGSGSIFGGGFGHFYVYAPIKIEYCIDRYAMEVKRLLDVLERHFKESKKLSPSNVYVCGDTFSIADVAIYPWIRVLETGYDAEKFLQTKEYKYVEEWKERVFERKAVKRGLRINTSTHVRADAVPERHSREDFAPEDY